jgi:hypothetical protein
MPIKEELICDVCKKIVLPDDEKHKAFMLDCGHDVCEECAKGGTVTRWLLFFQEAKCPVCKKEYQVYRTFGGKGSGLDRASK